ncbi:TPA: terminase [Yersinia enterocolitica]|nr:terminase [Yersinia enterocolitica]
MLFSDSIVEDAQALCLEDELFLLRARNLYTAENIGRWRTQLDDYGGENRDLQDKISAAENAMMRNTTRIESIEGTLASIRKMCADADYREVATEKLLRESDRERGELELEGLRLRNEKLRTENEHLKKGAGGGTNEVIIHNSLSMPSGGGNVD